MARYCPYCVSKVDTGNTCPYCNYAQTYRPSEKYLRPGTILNNKYLVGRVLGSGGFGVTYLGRDLTLEMKVAIKEYFPQSMVYRASAQSAEVSLVNWSFSEHFKKGKEQFILEAQTIAKLDKENAVVTVRDFFEQNNSAYIVMEFVEGQDLREIVEGQNRPMDSRELLSLLEPLFSAVGEVHELGLVHRDISPDNIMLENGRARLIDFGCARETLSGSVGDTVLKHNFSPVEQYYNRDIGPWTDVYSMAATIYYCITGQYAPKATDRMVKDELIPPTALGAKLTKKQEKAILKALAVNYRDRYQSMAEFGKDLFVHKNRYKAIAITACIMAVLIVAGFGVYDYFYKPETIRVAQSTVAVEIPYEEMSEEEQRKVDQLTDVLKDASVTKDPSSYSSYYMLEVKNNTDFGFDSVFFDIQFYNSDEAIVGSPTASISNWTVAKTNISQVYCLGSPVKAMIAAGYTEDARTIQTEYVEIPVLETEKKKLDLKLVNELPEQFVYGGYSGESIYTISSFDYTASDSAGTFWVTILLGGTYESGKDNANGYLAYRITDSSGAVMESSTFSIPTLKVGEKFAHVRISVYSLPAGEYYFEIVDYSY